MLDAAHGEGIPTVVGVLRIHPSCAKPGATGVDSTCSRGRGTKAAALRADNRQGSRRDVAVARSRRMKQSLE